jgi:O-antigen/teichoic acid export membrane protein
MPGPPADSNHAVRRRFAADVIFAGAVTVVGKLRGIILLPVISKMMGEATYGVWVQAIGLITLFAPIAGLNLYQSLIRFSAAESAAQARRTYLRVGRVSLLAGIALAAILYAAATPLTPIILGDDADVTVFRLCVLLVPLTVAAKLNFAYLRARGGIKASYALEGGINVISVVVAGVAFALGFSLAGGILAWFVAQLVIVVVMTVLILARRVETAATREVDLRAHIRYALPTIPGALADWALVLFDRYVIAFVAGGVAVGIYSANYTAAQVLLLFATPFEFVLLPVASSLWDRGERHLAVELVTSAVRVFLLCSVPAALALVVYGRPLLATMSTHQIGAAVPALLPALSAATIVWGCTRLFFYLFLVEKRSGLVARIVAIAAGVNVVANLIFVPRWGAVAAAWITLASYLVAFAVTLYAVGRARLRAFPPRWIGALLAAAGAMAGVLALLPTPRSLVGIIASSAIGLAGFAAAAVLLGAVNKDTMQLIFQLRHRRHSP